MDSLEQELDLARRAYLEQARLLTLAEAMSGVGHWRYDLRAERVTWSQQVYRIHGLDPGSFDPSYGDAVGFYHPDDQVVLRALVQRAATQGVGYDCQLRINRVDGALRHVVARAECEFDQAGAVIAIAGVFQDITEHVVALDNARQSEAVAAAARAEAEEKAARAAVAERIAGLGHWRIAFPSRALTWSDEMYVIYGLARDAPLDADAVMAMVHPDDRAMTQDRLDRDLRGAPSEARPVIRIVRPDGAVREVLGDTRVERDAWGAAVALVGTLTDVTQQRQVERTLAESQARYKLLAENVTDMIVSTDLSGRVLYTSPSCKTVMGYSDTDLSGTRVIERAHPDDAANMVRVFKGLAQGRPPERFRWRAKHKDTGAWVWLESKPCLVNDPRTGAPLGFLDVIRDVREQHAAEALIAESEARFRLVAENATDMIVTSTLEGRTTYISPSGVRLTGYSLDEIIGSRTLDLVYPDDGAVMIKAFRGLVAGRPPEPVRWRGMRKSGGWTWFESMPSLVVDPDTGASTGFVDVVRDVTAQVAQEQALRDAQAIAEAATAVKTEFLANMSHELRTPLTSILGFSDLLRSQVPEGGDAARFVDRISGASQALLTIVNDILDFSKLEAGQVEIDLRPVEPVALVRAALDLMTPQASAKGIALAFEAADTVPAHAAMDDTRVRQVLLNLLSNAVKFTDAGTVVVHLSTTAGRLRCEIADTGPGIPDDKLDRLFQRFSQVDASTTRSHGGTGLGLAICKGLVEAMQGRIGAVSVPGEGSTFWFELPCAPIAAPQAVRAGAGSATGDLDDLAGLRVLVADDNPVNRELVRLLLGSAAIEVTDVDSGEAAIAAAMAAPFDVILMDIRMPGLGGPVSAQRIRQGGGPNDLTPILAFTADADTGEMPAAWGRVFNDRLGKPIVPLDLFGALSRWAAVDATEPAERLDQVRGRRAGFDLN